MGKPKILYLSTSLNIGGTEKFLVTLVERLRERYEIHAGYLREKGILGELLESKGMPVVRFSTPFHTASYIQQHNIQLVHTFLFWANVLGRCAGRVSRVPVVSTQQSVDVWKKAYHTLLDRWTAPLASSFIVNSKAAAQRIETVEKVPAEKIRLVYNGVGPAAFAAADVREKMRASLGLSGGRVAVASVLRLHHDKGADFIPGIALRAPDCEFVVAGDGPLRQALEERLSSEGLSGRVRLLGWRDDITAFLSAADIFLLPSREESFPQAILEAMAAGLPVVAADVGGVRELVDEQVTGMVVAPGAIEDFAAAVRELAADGTRRAAMGAKAREKAMDFSEERMVDQVDRVYREFIK